MTGKDIADRLEAVEDALRDIDSDILFNFEDSKESVLLYARGNIKNIAEQVALNKFYIESVLNISNRG